MRKPILYNFGQGQMLYAVLEQEPFIQVRIERPDGCPYGAPFWSIAVCDLPLGRNEFVANTWGDHHGLMASAMFGTGWFERTGRDVAAPADEVNEVWRLSRLGVEWLDAQRACAAR